MSTLRIHIVLAGGEYTALIAHPADASKSKPVASINAAAVSAKPALLDDFAKLVRDAVAALIEAKGAGPVLEVRTTKVEGAPV